MDVKVTAGRVQVRLDFSVKEFKTLVSMLGGLSIQDWCDKSQRSREEVLEIAGTPGSLSLYERLFNQARALKIL